MGTINLIAWLCFCAVWGHLLGSADTGGRYSTFMSALGLALVVFMAIKLGMAGFFK